MDVSFCVGRAARVRVGHEFARSQLVGGLRAGCELGTHPEWMTPLHRCGLAQRTSGRLIFPAATEPDDSTDATRA